MYILFNIICNNNDTHPAFKVINLLFWPRSHSHQPTSRLASGNCIRHCSYALVLSWFPYLRLSLKGRDRSQCKLLRSKSIDLRSKSWTFADAPRAPF